MVSEDSGLPEPPSQDDAVSSNADLMAANNESESDEESNEYDGYQPLPTNPDHDYEEEVPEEIPMIRAEEEPRAVTVEEESVREVWSSSVNSVVDIAMDEEKEDLVRRAMVNFTLPESAIPEWAADVPEEQWKEHLMRRIEGLNRND